MDSADSSSTAPAPSGATHDPARLTRTWWAIVCIVVVVLRIALALTTPAPATGPDGLGYDDAARRLVTTGVYAWVYWPDTATDPAPNAQHLPGYPAFLAALYAVVGPDTPPQPLASIVQAVLSGLTLFGIALLGARIGGERAGSWALALGAAYPPFWLAYREVLTEDLFMLLCVWAAVVIARAMADRGVRSTSGFAMAGALVAAATYVRALAVLWAVVAVVLVLLTQREHRNRLLRGFSVCALVLVLAFAPWWHRNARIYDTFVPFNTMTASANLVPTLETEAEADEVYASLSHGHLKPSEELAYNRRVSEVARERRHDKLAADASGYIWRKARLFMISIFTYHPNPFGGFTGIGGLVEITHLSLLGLAALGWWRHRHNQLALVLLMLPVALVLVHGPTLSFSRYFYPMMGFVTVMAGVGLRTLAPARPHR